MLSPYLIRSYGSLPIEHTMTVSDGECTASGCTLRVRLELTYPDGSQYYRPTNEMRKIKTNSNY